MDILAQNEGTNVPKSYSACSRCGRLAAKLFTPKFKSTELCGDCFWSVPRTTKDKPSSQELDRHAEPRPAGRKVCLYLCFGCKHQLPIRRMSACLVMCKQCVVYARASGTNGGNRFIEKSLHRVATFLRGRI